MSTFRTNRAQYEFGSDSCSVLGEGEKLWFRLVVCFPAFDLEDIHNARTTYKRGLGFNPALRRK